MRDPKRIPELLNRLANAWKQNPDLRLGQLIVNALPPEMESDPFHIEDEKLIKEIERFSFASFSEARRVNHQRGPAVTEKETAKVTLKFDADLTDTQVEEFIQELEEIIGAEGGSISYKRVEESDEADDD